MCVCVCVCVCVFLRVYVCITQLLYMYIYIYIYIGYRQLSSKMGSVTQVQIQVESLYSIHTYTVKKT